ncbi:MAG TPA: GyrI-like domain-containing protein [Mycobacteriales bacterium]|nr:GyrI-like domain-containing protein [Mycobacteriales bacterium]
MTTIAPVDAATLYRARAGRVDFVDVGTATFLVVDGSGDPGGTEFAAALSALFPVAYALRFALRERGVDEKVSPLEALWWSPSPVSDFAAASAAGGFTARQKQAWRWQAMIRVPQAADEAFVVQTARATERRRPELAGAIDRVRYLTWTEGRAAQTLHVGPYSEELRTVQALHAAIAAAGCRPRGRHHEIYLSDPRRCAPERLRTILRQPVEQSSTGVFPGQA